MKTAAILNELDMIIAHAEQLKDKATILKKKLARVDGGAPRKGRKVVSDAEIAKVLAKRRKYIMRSSEAPTG